MYDTCKRDDSNRYLLLFSAVLPVSMGYCTSVNCTATDIAALIPLIAM
jgi:hypothetical protein